MTWSGHQRDSTRVRREVRSPLTMVVKLLRSPAQLPPCPFSHVRSPASICTGDIAAGRSTPTKTHTYPPETPSRRKPSGLLAAGLSNRHRTAVRISLAGLVPLNSEESSESSASNMRSSSSRSQESRCFKMS